MDRLRNWFKAMSSTPIYKFDMRPEDAQPSGVCDFSKIYNPPRKTLTINPGKPNEIKYQYVLDRTTNKYVLEPSNSIP